MCKCKASVEIYTSKTCICNYFVVSWRCFKFSFPSMTKYVGGCCKVVFLLLYKCPRF